MVVANDVGAAKVVVLLCLGWESFDPSGLPLLILGGCSPAGGHAMVSLAGVLAAGICDLVI